MNFFLPDSSESLPTMGMNIALAAANPEKMIPIQRPLAQVLGVYGEEGPDYAEAEHRGEDRYEEDFKDPMIYFHEVLS